MLPVNLNSHFPIPFDTTLCVDNRVRHGVLLVFLFLLCITQGFSQETCGDGEFRQITQINGLGFITGFADLNHNGKLDIVGLGPLVPNGDYYLKIVERENDTSYVERSIGRSVWKEFPEWTGDCDGDGRAEILTSRYDSTGSFRELLLYESFDALSYPDTNNLIWTGRKPQFHPVYCEDLDGDGMNEFIFVHFDSMWVIQIWEAQGDNQFALVNDSIRFTDFPEIADLSFGDTDGDGKKEIIFGRENGEVGIVENYADNRYALVWSGTTGVQNSYASAYLGDSDGDGNNEFVVGGNQPADGYHLLSVFESAGDNAFQRIWEERVYNFPLGFQTIRTGDIDGNGNREIAFYNSGDSTWFFRVNLPIGFRCLARAPGGYWFQLYDLNGNGRREFTRLSFDNTLVFEFDTSITNVSLQQQLALPKDVLLAFPNPFNDQLSISISLSERAHAQILVYDVLGRKMASPFDSFLDPGPHTVGWDGKDSRGRTVASGVYVIVARIGAQIRTVNVMFLK